ncbi:MAG: hypothetical protein QM765_31270 [Myxococcales bacterium]
MKDFRVSKDTPQVSDEQTEKVRFISSVQAGLAEAESGRTVPHEEAVRQMKDRFATRKR